jgi:hypothetical protein
VIKVDSVDKRIRHRRRTEQRGKSKGKIGEGGRSRRELLRNLLVKPEGVDSEPARHPVLQFDEGQLAETGQPPLSMSATPQPRAYAPTAYPVSNSPRNQRAEEAASARSALWPSVPPVTSRR